MRCASIAGRARAPIRPSPKRRKALGKSLAQNGVRLVYGGGSVGMMGTLARAVLDHGGKVTGIIPEFLTGRERPKPLTDDMIVTRDMHERKRKMFEHADAFVALPGGIGTLEELVEQLTWAQIGQHKKPVLLANIKGFWEPFRALIGHMDTLGFIYSGLNTTCSWPTRSRIFCRSCAKRRAAWPTRTPRWRCRRRRCRV